MANVTRGAGGMAGRNIIGTATYMPATRVPGKDHIIPAHMAVVACLDARDPRVQKAKDGNLYLTNKPQELSADEVAKMPAERRPKARDNGKFYTTNHMENYSMEDWAALKLSGAHVEQAETDSKSGQQKFYFVAKANLRVVGPKGAKAKQANEDLFRASGKKVEKLKFVPESLGPSDFNAEPLNKDVVAGQAKQGQAWRDAEIQRRQLAKEMDREMAAYGQAKQAPAAEAPAPEAPEADGDEFGAC